MPVGKSADGCNKSFGIKQLMKHWRRKRAQAFGRKRCAKGGSATPLIMPWKPETLYLWGPNDAPQHREWVWSSHERKRRSARCGNRRGRTYI
jgi:hypothetical protein